jgi:H+-transporting ATPase
VTASQAKSQSRDEAGPGLTSEEARALLAKFGPNTTPDTEVRPLRRLMEKFWAPVPWMLEAAIALQLALGKFLEAAIIAALLALNAGLGFFQEGRAQATVAALKSRLALNASVRRDGVWKTIAAAELAPGDVVKLSLGAIVPADVRLTGGQVLLDHSTLTGESALIEAGAGAETYAGALVRRGEAVAEVAATGARTRFGRTAELVRSAHAVSSQQKAVLGVVRNLAVVNGVVTVLLIAYALWLRMSPAEIVSLGLTAVLAAIPVALPATFTLAAAIGARRLAGRGVLPTRLSAVDEAASMDVLCSDKTGTLTRNALAVTAVRAMPGFDEAEVLALAALASSDGGADPVDQAIRAAAGAAAARDAMTRIAFVPFDPSTKMSEATTLDAAGNRRRVAKGAFAVMNRLAETPPEAALSAEKLEAEGARVLGVAAGSARSMALAGLVALSDPPREDSGPLIADLGALGVRTVMVTGDSPITAAAIARKVGLDGPVCPAVPPPGRASTSRYAVFAGVLPEDKFELVKAFQALGHVVGMCGDGVNDAPALRQAQMGIAVSTATDVAKSAAGMVLTAPGLDGVVAAVRTGRAAFQRILSYTLNLIAKKTAQAPFLGLGMLITGHVILTPYLMVLIMITGDFLGMALTVDNVQPSPRPNAWRIDRITIAGGFMGLAELAFWTIALGVGVYAIGFGLGAQRTLAFLLVVFGNQAACYNNRDRRHWWSSRPSAWLIVSSIADILIASALAFVGIGMTPLPASVIAATLGAAAVFMAALDWVKAPLFSYLRLA